MTLRRLLSVIAILFFNLLVGFLYIQPSGLKTLMSNISPNETDANASFVFPEEPELTAVSTVSIGGTTTGISMSLATSFNFTLNPQDLCAPRDTKGKGKISLLVLVCTAVPNFEQRITIRQTWGSTAGNNSGFVRLGFLVGATSDSSVQKKLEVESLRYNDVIQQDFVDSYQNLTLKSVMLLKWVNDFCPNVQFVMKTDDDMYVHVPNLVYSLTKFPVKSNVLYGYLFKKAKPDRNPKAKWYVPKDQFDGDVFPDYLSGTGYVMSRDVVPKLLEACATLPFLVMEDVFITGLCASQCHVKRYNIRGFGYWRRPPTGCAFKDAVTGHHVTMKEMVKIWKELQKRPLVCRPAKKTSKAH